MYFLIVLFVCTMVLSVRLQSNKPPPRRDDTYPPPEVIDYMRPIHDTCMRRTGVTQRAIEQFSDGEEHDDAPLKCYMACSFEELGVIDPKGDVHLESLYNMLPESMKKVALKMGMPCLKVRGEGPCERAFWLNSCWKRADPVHYFIL